MVSVASEERRVDVLNLAATVALARRVLGQSTVNRVVLRVRRRMVPVASKERRVDVFDLAATVALARRVLGQSTVNGIVLRVCRWMVSVTDLETPRSVGAPELVLRLLRGVLPVGVLLPVLRNGIRILLLVLRLRSVVGIVPMVLRWVTVACNKAGSDAGVRQAPIGSK